MVKLSRRVYHLDQYHRDYLKAHKDFRSLKLNFSYWNVQKEIFIWYNAAMTEKNTNKYSIYFLEL